MPLCPKCKNELIERNGKHGAFMGCINYPECRYSRDVLPSDRAEKIPKFKDANGTVINFDRARVESIIHVVINEFKYWATQRGAVPTPETYKVAIEKWLREAKMRGDTI